MGQAMALDPDDAEAWLCGAKTHVECSGYNLTCLMAGTVERMREGVMDMSGPDNIGIDGGAPHRRTAAPAFIDGEM